MTHQDYSFEAAAEAVGVETRSLRDWYLPADRLGLGLPSRRNGPVQSQDRWLVCVKEPGHSAGH